MGQTVSNAVSTFWDFLTTKPGEPGYRNRQAALGHKDLAQAASARSRASYKLNDHVAARQGSNVSKHHWQEYHRLNALAQTEIFKHHNPNYPTSLSEIDLHGLYVKEALAKVEQHVALCKEAGLRRTVLITGWGRHSQDGFAKIKPAMQELCIQEGLKVFADQPNKGCMTVEFGVVQAEAGWDKCAIM